MRADESRGRPREPRVLRVLPQATAEDPRAWEEVETGRYMPRRIRGSFRGRELG